jgi:hypothetical protein
VARQAEEFLDLQELTFAPIKIKDQVFGHRTATEEKLRAVKLGSSYVASNFADLDIDSTGRHKLSAPV